MSPLTELIGGAKAYGWNISTMAVASFESIATASVASTSASVTFSSIPATYKHLQIRGYGKVSGNDGYDSTTGLALQFNSDTSAVYNSHFVYGLSYASPGSGWTGANQTVMGLGVLSQYNSGNVLANTYSPNIIDIFDYTNTNIYKVARCIGGDDKNGTGYYRVQLASGLWRNTSAINSITLLPQEFSFRQYSHFALYGIKG